MNTLLKTHELTKIHQGQTVVDAVSITLNQGQIMGLVGPNGAGKTTLMKLILNLIKPTHGEVDMFQDSILEHDFEYLRHVGSLIETPIFYPHLSLQRNLEIHAEYLGYYNPQRIETVLDRVGLTKQRNLMVKKCSLGMKQRLGVARAILCEPKILLLDEPVNGLDPAGMRDMRKLFIELAREEGMAILISSHMLSELEQVSDVVAIMQKGKIIEQLTMAEIQSRNLEYYILETNDVKQALVHLNVTLNLANCKVIDDKHIRIYDQQHSYQDLLAKLMGQSFEIIAFEKEKKTLEDFFMNQTEKGDLHV